jgi:Xaa-Pro aminopeptidase
MFQSFDDIADPSLGAARLALLRPELARRGLAGFLVPRADEWQGEYVPASAERLKWLTGFSGSAGMAVVLVERAALFVDGRYTLQAKNQVDTALFEIVDVTATPPSTWLPTVVAKGDRIGYDPWLHTLAAVRRLRQALEAVGAELVETEGNPLDAVWANRPAPPLGKVSIQPRDLTGADVADKVTLIAGLVAEKKADVAVVTQPDSIAWTFDIRGADVPHTPLALSFALIPAEGRPTLFIDGRKLGNAERDHIEGHADVAEPAAFAAALEALGRAGRKVLLDPNWAPDTIARSITAAGGTLVEGDDPIILPKARKNAAEIGGTRAAHERDGAAFAQFLAWFDREAPGGGLDEITAVEMLEDCRRRTGHLVDISFDTISGAGPNGAIVHYRVTRATNRKIEPGTLFLIDSGAQYRDGTTDITRTIAVGEPTAEMRDRFTRVLKGHIAIATARFPKGSSGAQLDTLARHALWQAGLDYDHGTGHGVGVFLSVHEGPQGISKRSTAILEPGMIVSNEPGYYKTGEYGIRIENLVLVTEAAVPPGGDRPMHGFETLTFAPIDRRLIDTQLLTRAELQWLDQYHARVASVLGPLVDEETRGWLMAATARLD